MIFAASIVYFDPADVEEAKQAIAGFPNMETHFEDLKEGKIIITIEAEDNNGIEESRRRLMDTDIIHDVSLYAFYFGEEVEKVLQGAPIPDFNIENAFKKHSKK